MLRKSVCFLGYSRQQTRLVEAIEAQGFSVSEVCDRVDDLSRYDLVISFGYRYIINATILQTLDRPIINLHISYLPYNRGAHPNFWSWIDGTPAGVSIHEIDSGIDTGPVCFQRRVPFYKHEKTFSASYKQLIIAIEDLFLANMGALLKGTYIPVPQVGGGSYHKAADLPKWVKSWDIAIEEARCRYANES